MREAEQLCTAAFAEGDRGVHQIWSGFGRAIVAIVPAAIVQVWWWQVSAQHPDTYVMSSLSIDF
jgi:hypothetical protein